MTTGIRAGIRWASVVAAAVALAGTAHAESPEAPTDHPLPRVIQHTLAHRCLKCHGPDRQESKLELDSRQHVLTGGSRGPAIVPGQPEASILYLAIVHEHDEVAMPPDEEPLPEAVTAAFRNWIADGALWPDDLVLKPGAAGSFSDEDRAYWAFQPVADVQPPRVDDHGWSTSAIDRFIYARWQSAGLSAAPPADRRTLVRRAYFDLWGLPPTVEQLDRWLADPRPDWYPRLIDHLLASPRYGQRWARHWLDLVRYAESDGFKADVYRPLAWRYRDYVIRSLNHDKPYDRFLEEQLAGDELFPDDPEARIATGYLRLWPLEDNQKDVRRQWELILQDVTEITGEVFLGLGIKCARCHDHKYDPILQKDYYRLQAFFAAMLPRDDLSVARGTEHASLTSWERETYQLRQSARQLRSRSIATSRKARITFFPAYLQDIYAKPVGEWTPLDVQYAYLAEPQLEKDAQENVLTSEAEQELEQIQTQLVNYESLKPDLLSPVMCVTDVGSDAPPTYLGDEQDEVLPPGYLSILDAEAAQIQPIESDRPTTGRRAALARWLSRPDNPLTARVIVNRIWQQHFGQGIVTTANDFGRQGEGPTHPELLDWLARRLVESGWSFKAMHRLIMTSSTYRQSSRVTADAFAADPENRLLARMPVRRLDAEQIRDALLVVSGELEDRAGGPAQDADQLCRSIYLKNIRNRHQEMIAAFDGPDMFNSCARRYVTTTPLQSLLLLNGQWTLERAVAIAQRNARSGIPSTTDAIVHAYRRSLGRLPDPREHELGLQFLGPCDDAGFIERLTDYCHVLLCGNEFVYVD